MLFSDLGLSDALLRAVSEQGYSQPTAVQAKSIPVILDGRDVLAGAQTGTGKTAGFTLPLLQRLMESIPRDQLNNKKLKRPVRALILTPTRELASQVSDSVQTYGKYLPLRSNVVFGGVKISPQIFKLRRGCDILVATPGRLLDLINQRVVDLSAVEILVLDEADRMLDMGFLPSIKQVLSLVPSSRQSLLFSATYSTKIAQLAKTLLRSPVTIEVAQRNTIADNISHIVHPVEQSRKRDLLSFLIGSNNWQQVLVFTKTKRGADKLSKQLTADGLASTAIHGNLTQGARKKALGQFKEGRVRVLVATDVAARGLDIQQLSHVVNYELPYVAEDYIHRIGRTGRAGNKGVAISLMGAEERELMWAIEKLLKREVKKAVVDGYAPDFSLRPMSQPNNNARPKRRGNQANKRPSRSQTEDSGRNQKTTRQKPPSPAKGFKDSKSQPNNGNRNKHGKGNSGNGRPARRSKNKSSSTRRAAN